MGKYLKRIGTFFTMLLMLARCFMVHDSNGGNRYRQKCILRTGSGRLGKPLRMGMGQ